MTSLVWKGLDTSRAPHFIGYDQAERMVAALMDRAASWRPDAVVAIVRGGLVPGTMAASMLALPMFMVGCGRAGGWFGMGRGRMGGFWWWMIAVPLGRRCGRYWRIWRLRGV